MNVTHTGETMGSMLLDASWQAALLAVVVASVCRIAGTRLAPGWRFALWSLVIVRLACPVLPTSTYSALNLIADVDGLAPFTNELSSNAVDRDSISSTRPSTAEAARTSSRPAAPESIETITQLSTATNADGLKSDEQTQHATNLGIVVVGAIWAIVAGILLTRRFIGRLRLHAMASAWRDVADPRAISIFKECCRMTGTRRRVRLMQSEEPVGPALFGLWRPRIVIPANLLTTLSAGELRMLLLHELGHVRRCDVLWDRLATILAALHWFNPAAWWALARLRDAREQACDAAVLRQLSRKDLSDYGRLVMDLGTRPIAHAIPDPVSAAGCPRSLRRRLEMIASYRNATWKQSALGAMAVLVLATCGLTGAEPAAAPSDETANVTRPLKATAPQQAAPAFKPQTTSDRDHDHVIAGRCVNEDGDALPGVRVRLFRVDSSRMTREPVKDTRTDERGSFRFAELPKPVRLKRRESSAPDFVQYKVYYAIAASKPGRASWLEDFKLKRRRPTDRLELRLLPGGALSGRVIDNKGRPIAGAQVFTRSVPDSQPVDGVLSATTDSDGRYELVDLAIRQPAKQTPGNVENGIIESTPHCRFTVSHPEYGTVRPSYSTVPAVAADVILQPTAVIEGTVIDRVTGRLAAGVTVTLQGARPTTGLQQTRTDERGRYRLTSLEAGRYNLWAEAEERTCTAIDSLEVEAGQTYRDKNLSLIEGGLLEGKVVVADTGQPISHSGRRRLRIGLHGPARPKSGPAIAYCSVGDDGRWSLRVAPGMNFPCIMPAADLYGRVEDYDTIRKGINVGEGERVTIAFRILEEAPDKEPKSSPARLAVPVPDEREAVDAIR